MIEALQADIARFTAQADALEKNLDRQPDKESRAALQAKIDSLRAGVMRFESDIAIEQSRTKPDPEAEAIEAAKAQALADAYRELAVEQLAEQIQGKTPQEVIDTLA